MYKIAYEFWSKRHFLRYKMNFKNILTPEMKRPAIFTLEMNCYMFLYLENTKQDENTFYTPISASSATLSDFVVDFLLY